MPARKLIPARRRWPTIVAASAVACLLVATAQVQAGAGQSLPPKGKLSFRFRTTRLTDPDTRSARYDARLASDDGSIVVASLEHRICGPNVQVEFTDCTSTSRLPISFVEWTSTDRGATWPARPSEVSSPPCAPAEYIGATNYAVPGPATMYAVQNCATVTTVYRSKDDGRTWGPTGQPITGVDDDESLISADPKHPNTLYVVSHIPAIVGVHTITVSKSTNGGDSFTQSVVNGAENPSQARADVTSFSTNVLIDPRNSRHLYVFWVANTVAEQACVLTGIPWNFFTNAFLASSTDGGATWTERQIQNIEPNPTPCPDPADPTMNPHSAYHDMTNLFPDAAIDAAGNLYLVYAETFPGEPLHQPSHVMLMASTDGGQHFTTSQVDQGGLGANFGPSIIAGSNGRIDIAWHGSMAPDETDPEATWAVMLAQSTNALIVHPRFVQTRVSGLVHTGGICPLTCPDNERSPQHQTVGLSTDRCGESSVMWLDDSHGHDSTNAQEIPTVATQTAGPVIFAHPPGGCRR